MGQIGLFVTLIVGGASVPPAHFSSATVWCFCWCANKQAHEMTTVWLLPLLQSYVLFPTALRKPTTKQDPVTHASKSLSYKHIYTYRYSEPTVAIVAPVAPGVAAVTVMQMCQFFITAQWYGKLKAALIEHEETDRRLGWPVTERLEEMAGRSKTKIRENNFR